MVIHYCRQHFLNRTSNRLLMISCDSKAGPALFRYIHVNFSYSPEHLWNQDDQQNVAVGQMHPFRLLVVSVLQHASHQKIHFHPRQKNHSMMNRH